MVDKTFSYKLKGVMIYINTCNITSCFWSLPLYKPTFYGCYLYVTDCLQEVPSYWIYFSGCYQRTPLFICLCGVDEEQQTVRPRNLFLARLLVENGANVNYRVPMVIGTLVQCFVLFHNCAVHTAYFSVALIFPMERKRYNEFSWFLCE